MGRIEPREDAMPGLTSRPCEDTANAQTTASGIWGAGPATDYLWRLCAPPKLRGSKIQAKTKWSASSLRKDKVAERLLAWMSNLRLTPS